MELLEDSSKVRCSGDDFVGPGRTDVYVQLVISFALGISAFLGFCFLRPRWKTLYAARKRRLDPVIALPHLPNTFFGWIPTLWRVTEEQILASAGLDAFVFLSFFKMSIRLFLTMFFFAAVVLAPINYHYVGDLDFTSPNSTRPVDPPQAASFIFSSDVEATEKDTSFKREWAYLWAYLIFTYFFTYLTMHFMHSETFKIVRVRQDYLGTQQTITDRTFRLSGIPKEMRSEEGVKNFVQELNVGKVVSVTLCRNWHNLDRLVAQRDIILRKLEKSWSEYRNQKPKQLSSNSHDENGRNNGSADVEADAHREEDRLLSGGADDDHFFERPRPQVRIWYGVMRLESRTTDAIDYYEEKLRRIDQEILAGRKAEHAPTDMAFVTMNSTTACQMAIQACLDPRPGQLLTVPAPSPSDVVWKNTYLSRVRRRLRSWTVTIVVTILSVVWLIPVAFLASLVSLCTIKKVFPELAESLQRHEIIKALVQTGLPTGIVSLLNVAVPYLYDYLSNHQGMISQGDVELSVVSKNFFFTFFNIFFVFAFSGTATAFWSVLQDSLKDTTKIAYTIGVKFQNLVLFYQAFIMLQGIGLMPFRLLEFGSVALFPFYRFAAKTPRDFSELKTPPAFYYGFYLPTALLVFILCLIYSIINGGFIVLLLGVIYFSVGHFTYKYQLLYAMDQSQHATGRAWEIICYRILLGLGVFQITMAGYLASLSAITASLLVLPLVLFTMWYSYYYKRRFEPLTRYIALRSIRSDDEAVDDQDEEPYGDFSGRDRDRLRRSSTVDEDREKGLQFINPSLIVPLQKPWVCEDPSSVLSDPESERQSPDTERGEGNAENSEAGYEATAEERNRTLGSTTSSFSLGDTHVWRDNNGG